MTSNYIEDALLVNNISKSYGIWKDPSARLKVPMLKLMNKYIPWFRDARNAQIDGLYREFTALEDISFNLKRGTSMAIIGRNGSGKSTLLQIIAGTLQASHGEVARNGQIAALLELGSGFNPEFSGRTNVYMNGAVYGLSAEEIKARMAEVEDFAEIGEHIDQPVKTYSSGMMMRLAFSVQVLINPDILIVDEALSVGDIFFQQKCFNRMRRLSEAGTSVLFVSHDLVSVSQFTEIAMVLNKGRCAFLGKSSLAVKEYQILERDNAFVGRSKPEPQTGAKEEGLPVASLRSDNADIATNTSPIDLVQPNDYAFIDTSSIVQVGKNKAEFIALAVCDSQGNPATVFQQGDSLIVQCEILTHMQFECVSVGISIRDRTNVFVHGKHSIQHGVRPAPVGEGTKIAFQFSFALELALGQYSMDIGIIDISDLVDQGIPLDLMEANMSRVCLNDGFYSFQIAPRTTYQHLQLPFYGATDLDGHCYLIDSPVEPKS